MCQFIRRALSIACDRMREGPTPGYFLAVHEEAAGEALPRVRVEKRCVCRQMGRAEAAELHRGRAI